jgi:prepilin-type N-terminal cleavage/methylation domain-containing protein
MRRAFSLIELLLSVFILAIGIISVSALFPAGIAQQQQTADDQLGPVVAEQALGLLRSRVKAEDFGTFEEFGVTNLLAQSIANGSYVFRPSAGDWSWIRPGVIRSNVKDRWMIGEPDGTDSERVNRVAGLLESANIRGVATTDIRYETWYKLLINYALNPVAALTRLPTLQVRKLRSQKLRLPPCGEKLLISRRVFQDALRS